MQRQSAEDLLLDFRIRQASKAAALNRIQHTDRELVSDALEILRAHSSLTEECRAEVAASLQRTFQTVSSGINDALGDYLDQTDADVQQAVLLLLVHRGEMLKANIDEDPRKFREAASTLMAQMDLARIMWMGEAHLAIACWGLDDIVNVLRSATGTAARLHDLCGSILKNHLARVDSDLGDLLSRPAARWTNERIRALVPAYGRRMSDAAAVGDLQAYACEFSALMEALAELRATLRVSTEQSIPARSMRQKTYKNVAFADMAEMRAVRIPNAATASRARFEKAWLCAARAQEAARQGNSEDVFGNLRGSFNATKRAYHRMMDAMPMNLRREQRAIRMQWRASCAAMLGAMAAGDAAAYVDALDAFLREAGRNPAGQARLIGISFQDRLVTTKVSDRHHVLAGSKA